METCDGEQVNFGRNPVVDISVLVGHVDTAVRRLAASGPSYLQTDFCPRGMC